MRFYSLISEKDFDIYAPIGFTKTSESSPLPANTYAFNTVLKGVHLNDAAADKKGSFSIPIGFVQKGDFIKVSVELMSVSGVRPKVALDWSLTNVSGAGTGNSYIAQIEKVGEFEKLEIDYLVEYDSYYSALFGVFTGDVGEYYIKNCYVEIQSKYNTQPKRYKQGFRTYVVLGDSGSYSVQNNFGDDTATVQVDAANKELIVTHGKSFIGTKSGIGFVSGMSVGVSANYRFFTYAYSLQGCKVKIYDVATNTLQNPASITGQVWFNLFFSGTDPTIELI